jgi:diguanylate cyclase (GGDEF)-like protein
MKKSKLLKQHQAAMARAAAAEALYKAAVARAEVAEARERFAAEQREKFAAEREGLALARDKAAVERDAIANARDKAAADRDAIANTRYSASRVANGNGNGAVAGAAAAASSASSTSSAAAAMAEDDADSRDPELELAHLEARLQRAHLDALTGAYRREMGRLALKNEIDRARRTDGRFVIAFLDVDGLKGVNDREGHAAGDRILRTLVATMRANLRSYDPIVRFGGDEFICGIASIDPSEAQHRIHVIDQSLRNATGVGVTAGLAALTSNETLEELTARADAALIENKRNRPN